MPIPSFDEMMLPMLQKTADGAEYARSALSTEFVALHFNLSTVEQAMVYETSGTTIYKSRGNWALTYLYRAGLLERIARGKYRISASGLDLLKSPPAEISVAFLMNYPGFRLFFKGEETTESSGSENSTEPAIVSPDELLEGSIQRLQNALALELLERLRQVTPGHFEKVVIELLLAMGYGGSRKDAAEVLGKPGDGGIDGVIQQDRLGLDAVYVQAKRWESTVGRPIVQAFVGSLVGQHASKGVLMTTAEFSREAKDYARDIQHKVILIDGRRLAELMIEFNVGVSTYGRVELKRIDSDYFEES